MKLYTDTLSPAHLWAALPPGLELLDGYAMHVGPRTRRIDGVRLCSPAPRGKGRNYHLNSGHYGALPVYNATWDEHGIWMTRLFDIDPLLRIVGANRYEGREDFHAQTANRYEEYRKPVCADLNCAVCA